MWIALKTALPDVAFFIKNLHRPHYFVDIIHWSYVFSSLFIIAVWKRVNSWLPCQRSVNPHLFFFIYLCSLTAGKFLITKSVQCEPTIILHLLLLIEDTKICHYHVSAVWTYFILHLLLLIEIALKLICLSAQCEPNFIHLWSVLCIFSGSAAAFTMPDFTVPTATFSTSRWAC